MRRRRRGIDLHHMRQRIDRLPPFGAATGKNTLQQEHVRVVRAELRGALQLRLGIVEVLQVSNDALRWGRVKTSVRLSNAHHSGARHLAPKVTY